MNTEEFRVAAKKLVDYICEFRRTIPEQRVVPGPEIKANGLKKIMDGTMPADGENFEELMREYCEKVGPRLVHWNHPNFAAYFPQGCSYAGILGELLGAGSNQLGFSWRASPAITEHEQMTLNMYGKALDLPKFFLYDDENKETGGGAMQNSASDCVFLALLTARHRAIKFIKGNNDKLHDSLFLPYMVAYTSEEAHSCVQKAAKIAIIRLRVLPTDKNGTLHGDTLAKAIEHDVEVEGLTPIFVSATVGSTGICAFDDLESIGRVCKKYPTIWFHVDGAYAGNSFILPEMRHLKKGLELADSFNTNPNKLILAPFDCSCFWVKSVKQLKEAMSVNPTYLENYGDEGEDLRHFGIPLSRRFRSLKLWCVLRNHGVNGLQAYVRSHHALAKYMEALIRTDDRFEVTNIVHLGLVCFRLLIAGASEEYHDAMNAEFLQRMNKSGEIHMIPTRFHGKLIIRHCVTNQDATKQHIEDNWRVIQKYATKILTEYAEKKLAFQLEGKCDFQPRFSFTRSLSQVEYATQKKKMSLKDGAEAIYVCDVLDEVSSDDVFHDPK